MIITGSKSKTDYTPSLLAKSLRSILFLYCRGKESQIYTYDLSGVKILILASWKKENKNFNACLGLNKPFFLKCMYIDKALLLTCVMPMNKRMNFYLVYASSKIIIIYWKQLFSLPYYHIAISGNRNNVYLFGF